MTVKKILNSFLTRIPGIGKLYLGYKEGLRSRKNSFYPAGHFYSPIVSVEEIKKRELEIWKGEQTDEIAGIDLRTEDQIKLIKALNRYYEDLPFKSGKQSGTRYFFENGFYSYTDGIILHAMIRHMRPKRIIEIGSGFSSAMMLDTNELFFNNSIELTFIEPYPDRLNSLVRDSDRRSVEIIVRDAQSVPLAVFEKLDAGDILFIDSTHVVKTGSDVNYILFEILPRLKSGVLIHFHDVFFPFEYPKELVFMGRNWNEDYFLKAFLMYNNEFEIKLFSQYLHKHHGKVFAEMTLSYKNTGGNLWLARR
jgi:predicted O-methyltransferase YrrM